MKPPSGFEAAIEAGMSMGEVRNADGIVYAVLPANAKVERFNGEALEPIPRRTRGLITAATMDSFVDYFKRYADPDSSVFANPDAANLRFVGILDYHHTASDPRWAEHRVAYSPTFSKEWLTWTGQNNTKKAQVAFAQFIEDNILDIKEPAGNVMLEIAKTFQAKKNAVFSSDIRLDNGQIQLVYQEEIRGSATVGNAEIPEKFVLGIPVFYGGPPYRVEARLRYSIDAGHLLLWYSLVNVNRIIDHAFDSEYSFVKEQTKAPIIKGIPPTTVA